MATDLTWQQLSAQLPANSIFVDSGKGVCIDISSMMQQSGSDKIILTSQTGVVEFCIKLLYAGAVAQITLNSSITNTAEKLSSFPAAIFSTPYQDDQGKYYAGISASVYGRAPLDLNSTIGTNI